LYDQTTGLPWVPSSFTLTAPDGTRYELDASGKLTAVRFGDGAQWLVSDAGIVAAGGDAAAQVAFILLLRVVTTPLSASAWPRCLPEVRLLAGAAAPRIRAVWGAGRCRWRERRCHRECVRCGQSDAGACGAAALPGQWRRELEAPVAADEDFPAAAPIDPARVGIDEQDRRTT
jgi:Zn ribbon nucleic-acid-binding protein